MKKLIYASLISVMVERGLACFRMPCGELEGGSSPEDCDNLPPSGTEAIVRVFNYRDISSYEETNGIITDINLKPGKQGFVFSGFRNDAKKTEEVILPSVGAPMFKHGSGFVIYHRDQSTKDTVENLCRGRFVFAIEQKGQDLTSFEILGKKCGLGLVPGSIRDAHANGGFYVLNFATVDGEGELEPKLPQVFCDTDYPTSLAALNGLCEGSL
jgi:hypothetical protein